MARNRVRVKTISLNVLPEVWEQWEVFVAYIKRFEDTSATKWLEATIRAQHGEVLCEAKENKQVAHMIREVERNIKAKALRKQRAASGRGA